MRDLARSVGMNTSVGRVRFALNDVQNTQIWRESLLIAILRHNSIILKPVDDFLKNLN